MQYGKTLEINLSKNVNWHYLRFQKDIRLLGGYIKCILFLLCVFFNHTKNKCTILVGFFFLITWKLKYSWTKEEAYIVHCLLFRSVLCLLRTIIIIIINNTVMLCCNILCNTNILCLYFVWEGPVLYVSSVTWDVRSVRSTLRSDYFEVTPPVVMETGRFFRCNLPVLSNCDEA